MKLKYVLAILLMLPFITSCNNEDDVNAIFCSGTWTLINFYATSDWNKQDISDSKVIYGPETSQAQEIKGFSILFKQDGSFTATANGSTISGTWKADGKSRDVMINYTSQASGSAMVKLFFESLKNAKYYKGTDAFLQLAPLEKTTFMQFKH